MGCCHSAERKQKNEKENTRNNTSTKKEIKMLLLGAGESGKSTLLKQMRLLHDGGFSVEEKESYKEVIFSNTLQSMVVTLEAMYSLHIPFERSENSQQMLLLYRAPPQIDYLDQDLAHAISLLWDDAGVRACVARSREFQLNDSAKYYFDSIHRIGQPYYIPSNQDILRSRVKTTEITESKFNIGSLTYRMFDVGGQRSERKKWFHCFENVTALLFMVAISEYDQKLFEDNTVNRLQESLALFETICNLKWFTNTSIILFLNKIDLFAEKLPNDPLENYFSDYYGDSYDSAILYLRDKFVALNTSDTKQIYPHFTCATDTRNMKFVMNATNDIIINSGLRDLGLI